MKLALGTVQLGSVYGIQKNGQPSDEESMGILDTAFKHGINAFDTAVSYGNAELLLGQFVQNSGHDRKNCKIITKPASNLFDDIPLENYKAQLEKKIRQSLQNLHTDYLDGLLLHNAKDVYNAFAVETLIKAKLSGYVNEVGVSIYRPEEAAKALEYEGLDIIQVPYNVLDRRLDKTDFFAKCKRRGITVYARSTLLQGLLVMSMDRIPGKMSFVIPYVMDFQNTCRELELSPLECAIGFVLKHSYIDYLLFGTDTVCQLLEYSVIAKKEIDSSKYQELMKRFQDIPDRVVMPYLW